MKPHNSNHFKHICYMKNILLEFNYYNLLYCLIDTNSSKIIPGLWENSSYGKKLVTRSWPLSRELIRMSDFFKSLAGPFHPLSLPLSCPLKLYQRPKHCQGNRSPSLSPADSGCQCQDQTSIKKQEDAVGLAEVGFCASVTKCPVFWPLYPNRE